MSWIQLTSVTATNNSNVIVVNTGSTVGIKVGDALLLAGFDLVEIEGVFANQLQLRKPWAHATQSSVQAVVVPTFGDFNNAVEEVRNLRKAASDTLNELYENFVEKEEGKGLSTNDYDDDAKEKVDAMGSAASRDVMTSLVDTTTPNALMPRGAFGTGVTLAEPVAVPNIDAIDIPSGGVYQFASGNLGTYPQAGTVVGSLSVTHYRIGTGSVIIMQIAHVAKNMGGNIYKREYQNGEWSPWRALYHTGNAVGPVSQAGGVPTGGLMGWGETPNGRFFRYANGNQICLPPTHYYTLTEGASLTWVFPANFITTPQVTIEAGSADTTIGFDRVWVKLGGNTPITNTTQAVINYALNASATQFNSRLQIYAVGIWY
ncbi:TPA: pyocin knob domain-containing protein [Vibrio metschnikovii]